MVGRTLSSPLAGAIGDESVLPTMSTYLHVVVVLNTPYYNAMTHEPILLTFACGKDLSMRHPWHAYANKHGVSDN